MPGKTLIKSATCPLGKWQPIDDEQTSQGAGVLLFTPVKQLFEDSHDYRHWRERVIMKKLLIALSLLIAPLSYAKNDFTLKYTEKEGTITVLNENSDWVKVYDSSGMSLYLNDGGFAEKNGYKILHSKITYKKPEQFVNGESIHHIYSYGLVDCKKQTMFLIGDLYTNDKFQVLYKTNYQVGEYVADMAQKGTAANEAFNVICYDETI